MNYSKENITSLIRPHTDQPSKIISITSGKGGVGKSVVAANLGVALHNMGAKTLVVDGNLGLANLDQILGIHTPTTLFNYIQNDYTDLTDIIYETSWGIHLLPSSSGRRELANVHGEQLNDLIEKIKSLRSQYKYIIIDTPAGVHDAALQLSAAGDIVMNITTKDPSSRRDTFALMRILVKDFHVQEPLLVTNMMDSNESLWVYEKLEQAIRRFLPLSLKHGGYIPHDPLLENSVYNREPVMNCSPESSSARAIVTLARNMIARSLEEMIKNKD